ncbi:MAG: 30S ribosomal protein S13 [Euryarchaeota archaeon]|nr:30S ribosomal protein S13 [Euryarchaeota archaeon]
MVAKEEFKYLVRIGGVDIDGNKKVPVGLALIKGIGIRTGEVLCKLARVNPEKRIGYLTEKEIERLNALVEDFHNKKVPSWLFNMRKDYATGKDLHLTGAELAIALRETLNRLKKIRSYRGIRHELGLPVRGQRTRTGFRRGITVGVSKKKK